MEDRKYNREKIVVMLPTYKEEKNIGPMIEFLEKKVFPKIKKFEMAILIVDDNSPDRTADIVKKKMKRYKNIGLSQDDKRGIGAAFKRGIFYAADMMEASAVIKMDADFQHDPYYVIDLVREYEAGYDYVLGSRFIKGGSVPVEWGFYRKALSKYGGLLTRFLLFFPYINTIKDVSSGLKLISVEKILRKVDFSKISSGFYYTTQLLYQAVQMEANYIEIPIEFKLRNAGDTKMPFSNVVGTFFAMVSLSLKSKETLKFFKFCMVGFSGYIINALALELFFRLGIPLGFSAAIGTEMAIISNFSLNNIWTYNKEKITGLKNIIRKFFQFNIATLGAVVMQGLVVEGLSSAFGDQLRQLFLVIAILLLVIPYNYFMYNIFIWRTWRIPVFERFIGRLKKVIYRNR